MASEATYSTYALICLFAGAIVALGAQELHGHYIARRDTGGRANVQLLEQLHGPVGIDVGRLEPEDVERLQRRNNPPGSWWNRIFSSESR